MEKDRHVPIIAIVGRPNVGKSSLFNRLIHKRVAITSEIAGTTRDRIYFATEIDNIPAILVDTGGMEYGKKENIEADVQSQARLAIKEADLILFVVDVGEELTANDYDAVQVLRKAHKNILFIANKYDHPRFEEQLYRFSELGFGEPIKISTIHKIGLDELEERLTKELKKQGWKKAKKPQKKDENMIQICFAGRPNVGKSSLINALLGEQKLIVSPIAGTTRDAVDIQLQWQEQNFNLIDTAGVRRRGKVDPNLEKLSVLRSLEAIERADIVCLILDYERGISKQDMHISEYILDAGKGLLLVVNKSDLMKNSKQDQQRFINILRHRFDFLPWAPVVFVSALKHKNIEKIFELSSNIQKERSKKIDSDELDGFMKETTYKHLPPASSFTRPRIYHLEQTDTNPPTFIFQVKDAKILHFSYRRYLENELRKKYGFTGTAVRLIFKDILKKSSKNQ
jgi:GTP-binding protein